MPLDRSTSNVMPESARLYDHNGFIKIIDNPLSKVGIFPYSGRSIGAPDPDRVYMVYRPEEELSDPNCIESFKLTPWLDEHEMVGEAGGFTPVEEKIVKGVIGERVYFDSESRMLKGDIKLFSDRLADEIDSGIKKELSAGYRCMYEFSSGVFENQPYDVIQRQIRGNHLASVHQGRMGPDVAVRDHLTFTFDAKEHTMADETKKEEGKDAEEMSLQDLTKMVREWMPKVQAFMEAMGGGEKSETYGGGGLDAEKDRKAGEETRDSKGKDESEKEEKADKEAKDAEEKETKEKDAKDRAAKDAEEKEAKEKDMKDSKGMDMQEIVRDLAQRTKMAERVSGFVGTFDASEMTAQQVAEYGVKKLGIPCVKGAERVALDAYLHDRKPPHAGQTFGPTAALAAMDGSNTGANSQVGSYINGKST